GGHPDDLVPGGDLALIQYPQVEPGPVVGHEQRRDPWVGQPDADPVAGDPRLADLELGGADAVPVADADLVVGQALDGEVLAELAVPEVVPVQVPLPVPVRVELVHQDGALFAAVAGEVALAVAVQIE